MQGASVELRHVSKSFGEHPVVREVSLAIERGEFFSLLGPSGCGKTTMLRLIAGFERTDAGEIFYDGKPCGASPAYAHVVNLVFQHYALFPHMTVERNVAFGLEVKKVNAGETRRRVGEALELVHLTGLNARYPRELSGGQQQRVALARAIVTEPSILLLDEPLGALDLKLRRAMQLELKALQRRLGLTFIHVTHDQDEALAISDRVGVMHQGRLLQIGTPAQIYEKPATRFVAEFIGESNLLDARVDGMQASTAAGELTLRVTAGAPAQATFSIRPEKISLSKSVVPADNCFPGSIEETIYLGTDVQYRVRVGERLLLTVREQNIGHAPYDQGDKVFVSWRAEAATCVAADPV